MFAFLADSSVELAASATADQGVGDVIQGLPAAVVPRPTVMRILNDAGVADFSRSLIDELLARDEISVLCSQTGPPAAVC